MLYYIFAVGISLCIVRNTKLQKVPVSLKTDEAELLNRVNALRGIFAVLIVIGHSSMRFEKEPVFLWIIHKMNMIGVCFFLFVSGWGLVYSFRNKKDFFNNFIKRKILYLIVIAILSSIVFEGIHRVFIPQSETGLFFMFANINWYVYEAVYFYLGFYVSYKWMKDKEKRVIFLWAGALLLAVVSFYGGWERAYYYSVLSFPMGLTLCEYKDVLASWVSKGKNMLYLLAVNACILLGSCSCLFLAKDSFLAGVILRNIFGISGMIFLVLFVSVIKIDNVILGFLNRISTEIYLYQFSFLELFRQLYLHYSREIDIQFVMLVLLSTILFACIIRHINYIIKKLLMRLGK